MNPEKTTPEGHSEKKDFSELKSRLVSLIKQISGRSDVEVTTELSFEDVISLSSQGLNPKETWFQQEFADPKTGKIKTKVRIPEKILEGHEDIAKGKAAHEAGHVAITRFGRFVPDSVLRELGFYQLIGAAEERPTDQVVRDRYAGAGEWLDFTRKSDTKESVVLAKGRANLGYMPKSMQFCNLLVFGMHYDEIPEYYDREVIEIYEKTKKDMQKVEHSLPPEGSSEDEIVTAAKERYKILYKKIWPEAKNLVQEDLEKEKLRQMLNEALSQEENKTEEEKSDEDKKNNDEVKEALKNLREEFKNELENAISEAKKEQAEMNEEKDEVEKESGENKESGVETEEANGEDAEELEEEVPMREEAPMGMPIPMDKLGQKLIEALQKAFEKLPEELQEALKKRAREVLEKIEDQMVREFSGKLEGTPETHENFRERIEKEKAEIDLEHEKSAVNEELKEVERKQAALAESMSLYDKTYESIRELDERLYRELEEVFVPNIKRKRKLKSSGSKINLPAVFRWEAGRGAGSAGLDNKIFETVHLPEKQDYVFTILNDLSGSMNSGGKIEQDFKAKILFAEVLNRLGVRYELLGFQDIVINFKSFDESLNDAVRQKISGMLYEVESINPGGNNQSNWNDDGPCLLEASSGLARQSGKEKFLIVISDGSPAGRYSSDEDLHHAVQKIIKNTDQKLIALGLGTDTEHVQNFYPTSIPNIKVEELAEKLGDLLKDMVINPGKYSFYN